MPHKHTGIMLPDILFRTHFFSLFCFWKENILFSDTRTVWQTEMDGGHSVGPLVRNLPLAGTVGGHLFSLSFCSLEYIVFPHIIFNFFCQGNTLDKLSPSVMVTGSCPVIPLVALQNRSENQYRTVRYWAIRQPCQVTHVRISVILLIMEIHLNVFYCDAW